MTLGMAPTDSTSTFCNGMAPLPRADYGCNEKYPYRGPPPATGAPAQYCYQQTGGEGAKCACSCKGCGTPSPQGTAVPLCSDIASPSMFCQDDASQWAQDAEAWTARVNDCIAYHKDACAPPGENCTSDLYTCITSSTKPPGPFTKPPTPTTAPLTQFSDIESKCASACGWSSTKSPIEIAGCTYKCAGWEQNADFYIFSTSPSAKLFSKGVQEYVASSVADSSIDTITNAGCYYDCMTNYDHVTNCLSAPGSKQAVTDDLTNQTLPPYLKKASETITQELEACVDQCNNYCGEGTDVTQLCAGCVYQCRTPAYEAPSKDTIAHSPFAKGMLSWWDLYLS